MRLTLQQYQYSEEYTPVSVSYGLRVAVVLKRQQHDKTSAPLQSQKAPMFWFIENYLAAFSQKRIRTVAT